MTTTLTSDVNSTLQQIAELTAAGLDNEVWQMPVVLLAAAYRAEPWELGGSMFGLFGLYQNEHGWRPSSLRSWFWRSSDQCAASTRVPVGPDVMSILSRLPASSTTKS